MVSIALGFLLGILILQQFITLPSSLWGLGLLLCLPTLFLFWKYRFPAAALTGFLFAVLSSTTALDARLAPELEGNDVIIIGSILSIPDKRKKGWGFRLQIEEVSKVDGSATKINLKGQLKLSWYRTKQQLHAGEKWKLRVRLKQPAGFMNPGGFDYEKWLFHERVVATGYVRKSTENKKLADAPVHSINAIRENILGKIREHSNNQQTLGVISALSIADRKNISDEQWEVFRSTGTNHLIAISGLHIGMVAGFGFLPIALIWWLFPSLYLRLPVRIAGGIVGGVFALSYALLAGFTLPTQRALIMVLVMLYGLLAKRHYSGSTILSFALILVLIFDPLAVLSYGFWLSFLAVGLILLAVKRRLHRARFDVVMIQLTLSLGMLPLTLGLFGVSSLTAPLANLLAIPWVSIVVVPLTLLSILMLFILPSVGEWLLALASGSVEILLQGLHYLSHSALMLHVPEVPTLLLIIAFFGFLWLWMPKGFPARWLGLLLLLPLVLYRPTVIEPNAFTYHLLDVGQGLASVIQTRNHTLIYDAGPRFGDTFDTGKLVVVPFLQAQNIKHIDIMIISHEDIDHRGGAEYIAGKLAIDTILSSDTTILPKYQVKYCERGMEWVWDGVLFEMLHPEEGLQQSDNNLSCVLRVSNANHRLLLTSDIQKAAENMLLEQQGELLKAEVMMIPHHGSKTSSQQKFINAVQPQLSIAGTGYHNKFGFPKEAVVKRYQDIGSNVLHTANEGAISISFPADSSAYHVTSYRREKSKYWNRVIQP